MQALFLIQSRLQRIVCQDTTGFIIYNHMGPHQAKKCLRAWAKCAVTWSCACAKSHPGICSPFKLSMLYNKTCLRTAKGLIRLRGCAVWSDPSLSAYTRRHFFFWRDPYILAANASAVSLDYISVHRVYFNFLTYIWVVTWTNVPSCKCAQWRLRSV